jgi:subtilisin family serine protease
LIQRGDISFAEKVANCQAGHGVAAVIYNNADTLFSGTLGETPSAIPAVGISGQDVDTFASDAIATVTVNHNGDYAYFDGTSMATPHVSGVAALVWSQHKACTNQQVREALTSTALDLGPLGRDNAYGFGLVQALDANQVLGTHCGAGGSNPDEPPVSCTLLPIGASCSSDSSCCSNKCKGPSGAKTCK